ncbi:MAG: tRNA pseudouridine(13) synthase TruD [Planctomycetia bacterium]
MPVPAETVSLILDPPRSNPSVVESIRIRSKEEDFCVEEIPSYEPSGTGDHAWLWVEKRGLSSPQMISLLGRHLEIPGSDIGLAGQKDRWAVTRQYVSIPGRFATAASLIEMPELKVLSVTMHRNKLKTGHLKGNRFRLVLRPPAGTDFSAADQEAVQERLQQLQTNGFPNYYGSQRFGHGGNTIQDGLRLLKGKLPKDHWPENQSRTMKRLALNAVQSSVFNLVVSSRVSAGTASTPQPGDVVIRKTGIKPFLLPPGANPDEYVPAGPMPGPEMVAAVGPALELEEECLQKLGVQWSDFTRFARLTSGARRRMVEFSQESSVELQDDGSLCLKFSLTAGTYATAMLREIASSIQDVGPDESAGKTSSASNQDEDDE